MKPKSKAETPKKLYLTEDERKNINSRQNLMAEHNFYVYLLNNAIVEYLKGVVYTRLGLDKSKDYPLSTDGMYLIIEEDHGKRDTTESKV